MRNGFTEHTLCLQSIDQFRSFITDPYLLGQIATQHALSDIYAMGGVAKTAQVGLTLTPANRKIHQEDIYQVMSGVLDILTRNGASLVGGHTGEGSELAISISVQGEVAPEQVLKKQLTNPGNRLILTKAIGTGVIFAANMLAQANGRLVDETLSSMLQSNKTAMEIIKRFTALFDPQTSGGLLFSVPLDQTKDCLRALHQNGVSKARVIGEVIDENKIIIL